MPSTSALPISRPASPRPVPAPSGPANRPAAPAAAGRPGPMAAFQRDSFQPADFPPKGGLGPAKTEEEGKKLHMTQWGPTPYNAGGHEMGYADCGPTSGV